MITVKAYAKLNLYLDITGKADNGYHNIESVMQSIDLADDVTLQITKHGENTVEVICDNPQIPADHGNIAYKAATAFFNSFGTADRYKVVIDIKKRIPIEGGLGGSSTDGAAILTALNDYFGKPFSTAKLCKIGEKLGADLPFCIIKGTCSCTGIGGEIEQLPFLDGYFVILKPNFSFNTENVYKLYDRNPIENRRGFREFVNAVCKARPYSNAMYNVFEHVCADERISALKRLLMEAGAQNALMTGSGSAVFGVFGGRAEAKYATEKLAASENLSVFYAESVV